ncbi:MAG: hypothetical protein IPL86_15050 [Flavobacteriales bacterium]|nr:hypothetical protein [Flavobacteriales bacterium]
MDAEALNTFFRKQAFSTKDNIFARIYVNGDNHLENIKSEDRTLESTVDRRGVLEADV